MSKYPDYACRCCGYTNGDMFEDRPGERTPEEIAEFKMYRKMYYQHKEELKQLSNPTSNIWGKSRVGGRQEKQSKNPTRDMAEREAYKKGYADKGIEELMKHENDKGNQI